VCGFYKCILEERGSLEQGGWANYSDEGLVNNISLSDDLHK
jgi:hypothetical protein